MSTLFALFPFEEGEPFIEGQKEKKMPFKVKLDVGHSENHLKLKGLSETCLHACLHDLKTKFKTITVN